MISRRESADCSRPIRVIGPHTGYECLFNTSGEDMISRCKRIDASSKAHCNIWVTDRIYSFLNLDDIERIWDYGVGMTLNITLLRLMLNTRHEWSRK